MTEKTEYIAASIDLLEQEDELNSTELAVLCNLKKYMNKADHQQTFEVGEYYVSENKQIYKLTADQRNVKGVWRRGLMIDDLIVVSYVTDEELQQDKPATAEQIAEFKRAEIKNDIDFIIKDGDGDWIEIVENIEDYFQTAEELREVEG